MKPKMYSRKENFVQEWQARLSFQPVLTGLFVFIFHKETSGFVATLLFNLVTI